MICTIGSIMFVFGIVLFGALIDKQVRLNKLLDH